LYFYASYNLVIELYNNDKIYFNPVLKIGLQDVRNAWYLADKTPVQLTTIIYQGALYFRFPGSGRRISTNNLKTD